jgi:ABC-type sugar transport system, permease component
MVKTGTQKQRLSLAERFHRSHHSPIRPTGGDKAFYIINGIFLFLLAIIVIYPLWFIIVASFSDPDAVLNGQVWAWPVGFTISGYANLLKESGFWTGYRNTLIYVTLGTIWNLILTIPAGWVLSRDKLPFRKVMMWIMIVTMFFGGGLIPYYLLVSWLGLVNNPLSQIILGGVSVYNVFMVKSYFQTNVPQEIIEAAEVDGCGPIRTFFYIVVPLAKPIISVMILFYAVARWNDYFDALIFLSNSNYFPLQLVLHDLLMAAEEASSSASGSSTIVEATKIANQIRYASIIVSSLPIIIIYPFIQKHFDQGFLVGSFK